MDLVKSMLFVCLTVLSLWACGAVASAAIGSDVATSGASANLLKHSVIAGSPTLLSPGAGPAARFGCPLCDSSVYSYCSSKAVHDGCCCSGGRPPVGYGYPCPPARCNFLHANSCYEHQLIVQCCCNRP